MLQIVATIARVGLVSPQGHHCAEHNYYRGYKPATAAAKLPFSNVHELPDHWSLSKLRINLRNRFNFMNRVRCIAKPSHCFMQLAVLHQQIVGVERRYRENAYARSGQWLHERSQYSDFRKIKWAVDFDHAPTHCGPQSCGHQSHLRNDRKFIAGPRNRKKLPLRGPLRHSGIRSE